MTCDDYVDNENKENTLIDMDNIKKQLLSDQEKCLHEQKKSWINDTENNNNIVIDDVQDLKSKILNYGFADYVIKTAKKTVKSEDSLIRQVFYTALSAYSNKPISIGIKAPTSEGKTYVVKEVVNEVFSKKRCMGNRLYVT
jgi:hypothetical protein